MQGTVKFYNDTKGFGFIIPEDGTPDVFFHVSNCVNYELPQEGDVVSFEIGEGRDGRSTALNVTPADAPAVSVDAEAEEVSEEEVSDEEEAA